MDIKLDDEKETRNTKIKVNTIKFYRSNFDSDAEFYQTVMNQVELLTRNNFIVSLFTDTVLRESTIEFSSCLQNQLTAVPIWITPDEYLKYLEYIAESELPDDDPGDDSDTGNRA